MKKTSRSFINFLVGASVISLSLPASAQIIFNSLDSNPSDATEPAAIGSPYAASFSTGASAANLVDLQFSLIGNPQASGNISVLLLADNNKSPGSSIATLGSIPQSSLSDANLTTGTVVDLGNLDASLAANTRYWIELSSTAPTASWAGSTNSGGVGVDTEYYAALGGGVISDTGGNLQMEVTVSAVPETKTDLGLLIGIGLLGLVKLRDLGRLTYPPLASPPTVRR